MKTIGLTALLLLFVHSISLGQLTYVPDDSFENWIETNIAGASDGTPGNDYVLTAGISNPAVFYVEFYAATASINDFTGLEDFTNLSSIIIDGQPASSIDLSAHTFSATSQITVNGCTNLSSLVMPNGSYMTMNITSNPQLTDVVFQASNMLGSTYFGTNNSLDSIDISGTSGILGSAGLTVVNNPQLYYVNLANGQTINWSTAIINQNANLHCIIVDDPIHCENSATWQWFEQSSTPSTHQYSTLANNCGQVSSIFELDGENATPAKAFDLSGREVDVNTLGQVILVQYTDGTVRRIFRPKD